MFNYAYIFIARVNFEVPYFVIYARSLIAAMTLYINWAQHGLYTIRY